MQADPGDGFIRVPHHSQESKIADGKVHFLCRDLFDLVRRTATRPGIRVVALMRPLNETEIKQELEKRVRSTVAPARPKPAPVRHRSPNATNVGATTKKGSNAEVPNIGGTSRKSVQKRRRRERQSA